MWARAPSHCLDGLSQSQHSSSLVLGNDLEIRCWLFLLPNFSFFISLEILLCQYWPSRIIPAIESPNFQIISLLKLRFPQLYLMILLKELFFISDTILWLLLSLILWALLCRSTPFSFSWLPGSYGKKWGGSLSNTMEPKAGKRCSVEKSQVRTVLAVCYFDRKKETWICICLWFLTDTMERKPETKTNSCL